MIKKRIIVCVSGVSSFLKFLSLFWVFVKFYIIFFSFIWFVHDKVNAYPVIFHMHIMLLLLGIHVMLYVRFFSHIKKNWENNLFFKYVSFFSFFHSFYFTIRTFFDSSGWYFYVDLNTQNRTIGLSLLVMRLHVCNHAQSFVWWTRRKYDSRQE